MAVKELDLSENAIGDAGVRVLGHALSEVRGMPYHQMTLAACSSDT